MVQLESQELDNTFSLKKLTNQTLHFDRLKSGQILNKQLQSNDDNVEREIMTDEIETEDVHNQFPEDIGTDYWK